MERGLETNHLDSGDDSMTLSHFAAFFLPVMHFHCRSNVFYYLPDGCTLIPRE